MKVNMLAYLMSKMLKVLPGSYVDVLCGLLATRDLMSTSLVLATGAGLQGYQW